MHKIALASLLFFTLSVINSLNGCYTKTIFTAKTITQNPPVQNRIAEIIKEANLMSNDLRMSFDIDRHFLNAARIDTCLTYNDIILNPEQDQNIKKSIKEKKDIYVVAQQKNSSNTVLFKIEHKGITLR